MSRTALLWVLLTIITTIPGARVSAVADGPVSVVLVADDAGAPMPARVTVIQPGDPYPGLTVMFTDAEGKCMPDITSEAAVTVQVNHGPAWSIEKREVQLIKAGGATLEIRPERLYDLESRGYRQGDCHMHSTHSDGSQSPADVAYHCRCEGLDFAFLTDHETVAGQAEFTAQAEGGFLPLGGQEITTSAGHILGLGITEVVSRDVSNGADDISRIFRQVGEQRGVSVVAHPMVPMMNYRHWDVEDYDCLEILNGSAPPYMGLFDLVQGRLKWHALLNEGKRISAIGNSDNHDNYYRIVTDALRDPEGALRKDRRLGVLMNMPNRDEIIIPWGMKGICLGTYRTLLKPDEFTQSGILSAIRAGRGVVTNGPIIVATVNGEDPGAEIAGGEATVRLDAVCNRGLERVVVVVDGNQAQVIEASETTLLSQELTVDVTHASWLTIECYGAWPDFATTNAWYVK